MNNTDTFQRVYLGYEVRRPGTKHVGGGWPSQDRLPLGVVVERFTYPVPVAPRDHSEEAMNELRTARSIAEGTPAQIAVYWQDTKVVERLLETDVVPNYPGDQGIYRAWSREFPVFALESGGYGDVTILHPNGESAVYVYGGHHPAYEALAHDPEEQFKYLVRLAVEQYLTGPSAKDQPEPAETALAEQAENADFEDAQ